VIISVKAGKPLQPESAIDHWQQWSGGLDARPVILKALSGGLSNRNYLLESGGLKMVLRLNGPGSLLPDAGRTSEMEIWQYAAQQGLAPALLHVDRPVGYLVSRYIESTLPAQPQQNETLTSMAFGLLEACHRLDIDAPLIDYASHVGQYWKIIEDSKRPVRPALLQQRSVMQALLEDIVNSHTEVALCHHDPVKANFVGNSKRLYLIDWEYAAYGLRVMDYAAFAVEWEADDTLITRRTGMELSLLLKAKSFYGYLCQLWKEIS
jgi:thiamine kinase